MLTGCKNSKLVLTVLFWVVSAVFWNSVSLCETAAPKVAGATGAEEAKTSLESPTVKLLPEGYQINGLIARLVKHPEEARWFLIFEVPDKPAADTVKKPKPGENAAAVEKSAGIGSAKAASWNPLSEPIEVLPVKWLTAMNMIMSGHSNIDITFRIWGEIFTYQKRNYILLSNVATYSLFGQSHEQIKQGELLGPGGAAATGAATQAEGQPSDAASKSDQLREALMRLPRTSPLALPADQKTVGGGDSVAAAGASIYKDGDLIVDRVGRMIYDSDERVWQFSFESSGSKSEPPLFLHPSQLLEIMEGELRQSSQALRFRVSGQITQYQGRTYLLLRKMLIVHSLGNLTK